MAVQCVVQAFQVGTDAVHQFLRQRLARRTPGETLLLITHRLSMLDLVDRVIVLHNAQVALDGPRDAVLAQLSKNSQTEPAPARQQAPAPAPAVQAIGVSA